MLISHLAAVERVYLAIFRIPANSGHNLQRHTPVKHSSLASTVTPERAHRNRAQAEIIDCNLKPNERRNQIDIILYKPETTQN